MSVRADGKDCQRVAILGAGVIGLMSARRLLARGIEVLLFDIRQPGRAASWAGGGILSPLIPWRDGEGINSLTLSASAAYAAICDQLRLATGIDPQLERSGLLLARPAEPELAIAWARRHRRLMQVCDSAAIAALQPGLDLDQALWFPEVAQVRNPRLLHALLADVQASPACRLMAGTEVWLGVEGATTILRANGRRVDCDAILVSAGAWTARLLRPFGIELPLYPVRGQMLCYAPRPGLLRRIVLDGDGRYLIPRRDGRILVGSTLEESGFNDEVTPAARATLAGAAERMLPALAGADIEAHWSGLRPGSPGGIPFIDWVPDTRILVNAGHFRNGLAMAPMASELGVALLLGEQPPVNPGPYRLNAPRPAR